MAIHPQICTEEKNMRQCGTCGGEVRYISDHAAKCDYCGKLFSINDDSLTEANMDALYNEALVLSRKSNENEVQSAINLFEALGSYKDSQNLAIKCKTAIEKARIEETDRLLKEFKEKQRKKIIVFAAAILAVVVVIVIAITISVRSKQKSKYDEGIALFKQEKYEEALEVFGELKNYEDSSNRVAEIEKLIQERNNSYEKGITYYDSAQYHNSIIEFEKCKSYKDSMDYINNASNNIYEEAKSAYESGDYKRAEELINEIPDYSDAYNSSVALNAIM